jgi:hypothetical protein
MSIALPEQLERQQVRPETSFGPFRILHALPWLILAAAVRVIASGGHDAMILSAIFVADIAILLAFFATAQRSIETADGQSALGEFTLNKKFRLSLSILWRIAFLMIPATFVTIAIGYTALAADLFSGLVGMAFNQYTEIGQFWSAGIAALVLLMIVRAERNGGKIALFPAVAEFARRGLWLSAAAITLGVVNIGFGFGQEIVCSAIWQLCQTSGATDLVKYLIYYVFIIGFAMLRLWVTLTVLTIGLRQSYVRGD